MPAAEKYKAFGGIAFQPHQIVAAFDGPRWQLADEPQPGTSGGGGSLPPLLGNALAQREPCYSDAGAALGPCTSSVPVPRMYSESLAASWRPADGARFPAHGGR